MPVAGWSGVRTPCGSLGMWTAERRLLEEDSRRAVDMALREGCCFCGGSGGSGGFLGGFDELGDRFECRLDSGVGGGRRTGPRGLDGKALHLGFDVANPARSREPVERNARRLLLIGGMDSN